MMNKPTAALCFSGLPRFFRKSWSSLQLFGFLDKVDYKIFIHTHKYQLKQEISELDVSASFRYPDEGTLDEYLELYTPAKYSIDPYTDWTEKLYVQLEERYSRGKPRQDHAHKRYLIMLAGIKYCNTLRQMYEYENNVKFDYCIRLRSDLEYKEGSFKLEDLEKVKEGCILGDFYGNGLRGDEPSLGDVFCIAKPKDMDIYSDLCNKVEQYFQEGMEINTEVLLEHHMNKSGIKWELSNYINGIIRPLSWNKVVNKHE